MKTITEFNGVALRGAHEALQKLRADGVADDQLNEQLGAALNVTGDRLARLVEAVQAAGADPSRVRLVRVFAAEHTPRGSVRVGEFNYLIDLVPGAGAGAGAPKTDKRGGRDGGRGRGGPPGERRGPPAPRGLKSLRAPKEGDKPKGKDEEGDDARGPRGPMPTVGKGWVLTPAPGDRGRGGKGGKRPPGRNDRDRGRGDRPRSDRPGADARPAGDRPNDRPRGPRPPGAGDRPGGNRPPGQRPQGPRPPGAPSQQADGNRAPAGPGGPIDPNAPPKKRRHRGGRGRGRGGPGGPRPGQPESGQQMAPQEYRRADGKLRLRRRPATESRPRNRKCTRTSSRSAPA